MKALAHLAKVILAIIAGAFVFGIPLSLVLGNSHLVSVVSGLLGVAVYYTLLLWKDE